MSAASSQYIGNILSKDAEHKGLASSCSGVGPSSRTPSPSACWWQPARKRYFRASPEQPLAPLSFPETCWKCGVWLLMINCWILFWGSSWKLKVESESYCWKLVHVEIFDSICLHHMHCAQIICRMTFIMTRCKLLASYGLCSDYLHLFAAWPL